MLVEQGYDCKWDSIVETNVKILLEPLDASWPKDMITSEMKDITIRLKNLKLILLMDVFIWTLKWYVK